MARLVKRSRTQPYEVTVGGETQYICACGLSANLPFCDGTHAVTAEEEPGKLYWYDGDAEPHVVADAFRGIRENKPA
jgi:CDGSH iron-sulfur domain-containing protein 3